MKHQLQHLDTMDNDLVEQHPNTKQQKIQIELLQYVYHQVNVAMAAALFCASIIFTALFNKQNDNFVLLLWVAIFLGVTCFRVTLAILYRFDNKPETRISIWRSLYILGAFLGGSSWGLVGTLFLPDASYIQQTLMILMLAGVTAGVVPLSAAIPSAVIAFLISSIMPYVITLLFLKDSTYLLFDLTLCLYLGYMIILTTKAYKLVKNAIILQYENDVLLKNLEHNNKLLKQAATHDPLTQIANRRLFMSAFTHAIERAKQNRSMLALFFMDLDHFKEANDSHGHHIGDHVLQVVVTRLKQALPQSDMLARIGGDELAIIVENVSSTSAIIAMAQSICELIKEPIVLNQLTVHISTSIGISIYPHDGHDTSTLLHCADRYMYDIKREGGNNFKLSEAVDILA